MHLFEGKEKGKRQKEIRLDKKSCKWGLSCWRAEERVGKTGKQCIRDTTEASLLLLHHQIHHPLSVRFEDIIGRNSFAKHKTNKGMKMFLVELY